MSFFTLPDLLFYFQVAVIIYVIYANKKARTYFRFTIWQQDIVILLF